MTHAALNLDAERADSDARKIVPLDPISCASLLSTDRPFASFILGALRCRGSSSAAGARTVRAHRRGSATYRQSLHSASTCMADEHMLVCTVSHHAIQPDCIVLAMWRALGGANAVFRPSIHMSTSAHTLIDMRRRLLRHQPYGGGWLVNIKYGKHHYLKQRLAEQIVLARTPHKLGIEDAASGTSASEEDCTHDVDEQRHAQKHREHACPWRHRGGQSVTGSVGGGVRRG